MHFLRMVPSMSPSQADGWEIYFFIREWREQYQNQFSFTKKSFKKCLNDIEFGQNCLWLSICSFQLLKVLSHILGFFFKFYLTVQEQQSVFFAYEFLHWYYFHTLSFWKCSAQQLPLALNFISCQRVFDNMNGDTMWHILAIYRLLFKGVWILKDFW